MDTPLLSTKLFVPQPRPGLVARPRLMERMDEALSFALVLVSAPAGFGKTTAVSQWAKQGKAPPLAWVSLDNGDNDPVRFWDYFIAALTKLKPGIGQAASNMLHSPQPYPTESVLTALINDFAGISGDCAVVLDDYHLISSDAVHEGITFLLDHLPPNMHVIIAARAVPPLPLPRFRGRAVMVELGADDLRFTADETAALLKEMLGFPLSAEEIALLNSKTEGWAVGLKMAALSMRGRQGRAEFLASFTGSQRYVMDYLLEEVLKQQSDDVRDFLLNTSVLDRLCAPLCDAVTGRAGSQNMLAGLESSFGGFLIPLDDSRQWYRYHHLFGDLLRHQLQVTGGTDEVNHRHRLAGAWFEENDLPGDAIRHALAARDWHRVMALIDVQYEATVKRGEWDTLFGWFQTIPDEMLRSDPRLYVQYANVLITRGSLQNAEAMLGYLESIPNIDQNLRGELAFFRMSVAYRRGNLKRTSELGERAVEQLTEEQGAMRARALHILAVLDTTAGRLARAQLREAEALRIAHATGESWIGGTAAGNLGNILWLRGRLSQALESGKQAVELAGQSPGASWPHCMVGIVLYERNELEEAARSINLAMKWSELSGYAELLIPIYYCMAQSLLARGEGAEAENAMAKADEASRHPTVSPLFREWHVANRVMFEVRRGDLTSAEVWGRQLAEYPADIEWILAAYAPARLLIARGEKAAATERLRGLYERAITADERGCAIRIRVYQALATATQDEALVFLADALKMGEPEGFIRTFVDEGRLLAPLLRQAIRSGIEPDYARKLLTIVEAEERQRKTRGGEGKSTTTAAGVLSERETEVLGLMGAGLSDRQIAGKLTVSLSTAKTHVHRILEKLGATSRTGAVSMARERRLL